MGTALFIVAVIVIATLIVVYKRGGKAANARLRGYGIVVDGSEVKSHGTVLGPLAGAHAEVTDPTSRHTLTRVVTVAGALTKKTNATVVITLASGDVRTSSVTGAGEVRRAYTWAARFNALASAEAGKSLAA